MTRRGLLRLAEGGSSSHNVRAMTPSVRHIAFAAALLSCVAGAAFVGCAESPAFPDDDDVTDDQDVDASKPKPNGKDATIPDDDGDPIDEEDADVDEEDADVDDEDGSVGLDAGKDAGKDAGGKDAGGKDSGTDPIKDAGGKDAGNVFDAGPDDDDSGVLKPSQGEIVISEIMFNPSTEEPATEWFEVYNASGGERRLSGLTIKDKSRTHVIAAGVKIQPGAYVVLVRNQAKAAGVGLPAGAIVYDYGAGVKDSDAVQLGNDSKADLTLFDGATEIARVHYGALGLSGSAAGSSLQLKALDYTSANVKTNWCVSANAWAGADKGTPGAASDCN